MSHWVLAIDPGKTFGWALFCDGKLFASAHCSQKAFFSWKLSAQAVRVGMDLPPLPEDFLEPGDTCVVVGEKPNYRHQGTGKGDASPNDLITLSIFLGELVALYRRKVDVVEFVTAHGWKGSVKKEICHSRMQKVLDPDEQMPENHNARDAVGICLWKLGRYRR
jgi:hypothetical protein